MSHAPQVTPALMAEIGFQQQIADPNEPGIDVWSIDGQCCFLLFYSDDVSLDRRKEDAAKLTFIALVKLIIAEMKQDCEDQHYWDGYGDDL